MVKKKVKKSKNPGNKGCESCANCLPVGGGDHLCDKCSAIVIEEYAPSDDYMKCKGKDWCAR